MVNFGTPIVSIVDYNFDVRQENPALLNTNVFVQSSTSTPIYTEVINLGSLQTIQNIGYISYLPVITVGQVQGGVIAVGGGYISNISNLPPLAVTAISSVVQVLNVGLVSTVPSAFYDSTIIAGRTLSGTGSTSPIFIGGAKQLDIAVVTSTAPTFVSTASLAFSVIAVESYTGIPITTYNFSSQLTSSGAIFLTLPAGTFLGDMVFLGYTANLSSVWLNVYARVVAK